MEDSGKEQGTPSMLSFYTKQFITSECQRNALIYGICGGTGSGLLTFLCTSRPRISTHVAVGGYAVITVIYGTICFYKEYLMMKEIKELRRNVLGNSGLGAMKQTLLTEPQSSLIDT